MNASLRSAFAASLLLMLSCAQVDAAEPLSADHAERMKAGTVLFRERVRPVLEAQCLKCHGDEKVRSRLDLATREKLLEGGDSGSAIDLAEPGNSFLLALIRHEEEPTMPPKEPKLDANVIDDFLRWIELGAPYDRPLLEKDDAAPAAMTVTDSDREFWAFRPLGTDPPPATDEEAWARTDIDRFVLAKLRENGLEPSSPADDRTRIRRTYLDLVGLPPTPAQLEVALAKPQAELVDELLASPHFGERWARHWLDAARFAESHGFEQDYDRKFAYHYRDFVIKAFNRDIPWDQFTRWQLAGDEIAPDDPLALMATGFLGAGAFPTQLTEKEFESARYDELDDMAGTMGTAMLGLTIGCARCHDHKYDPIPTRDYYRLLSTFTTTIRSEIDLKLDPEGHREALANWERAHAKRVKARSAYESSPEVADAFERWLENEVVSELAGKGGGDWTILDIEEAASSRAETTLTPQADGSVLASGEAPDRETYTLKATTSAPSIRFVRIEALTHESMKRNGPGRAGNGNFALSHLKVFASPVDRPGTEKAQLKLVSARATHEQNAGNLSVAAAIDDNPTGTGWAVDAGGIGSDQAAVFELAEPLEFAKGVLLEFQLTFANNGQHSLGRSRFSVSASEAPSVIVGEGRSEALAEALAALSGGTLEKEQREVLFPFFAAGDSRWKKLDEAVSDSLRDKPQPRMTKVQVTSEGFPPTKHHADGRGFPHFYPETHFLERGDPNQKRGVVEQGFLQVLMRDGKSAQDWRVAPPEGWTRTSFQRTGLANWITDTENGAGHLLARVIVNRVWHHHFGRGIVATPNDFGLQGELPTHPELLDFLARRLIENGWSLKQLHRDVLTSATWLQAGDPDAEKERIDPENRWLWRFRPRRLEAEVVRDSMLAVSGQLDPEMYGPGTLDESQRRRSLYFTIKRSRLVPMMQIFDQPEPLVSQGRRPSTTIAPQALFFLNNAQVVEWAKAMAASLPGDNLDAAIRDVYLRTLGREPSATELERGHAFLDAQATSYDSPNAGRLALADYCQAIFGLNEFIYLP